MRRNERLDIPLTTEEKRDILAHSVASGMSMSEFVRACVHRNLNAKSERRQLLAATYPQERKVRV